MGKRGRTTSAKGLMPPHRSVGFLLGIVVVSNDHVGQTIWLMQPHLEKKSKTHPAFHSRKIWHAAAGRQYSFGKRTMQGWFGSEGGGAVAPWAGPAAKAPGTGAGAGSSRASSMSV